MKQSEGPLSVKKNNPVNCFSHSEVRPQHKRGGGLKMDTAISVQDVYKRFGEETVLTGVSHDFEEGKIHGIVGNNGSGKTVLMKCICGFLLPTKGKILVRYKQVGRDMDFPEDLGLIIETPGFLPNMSGLKNLQILASLKKKIDGDTIRKTIRRVGLDPDMKKPVGKYSLGMRQAPRHFSGHYGEPLHIDTRRAFERPRQKRCGGHAAVDKRIAHGG